MYMLSVLQMELPCWWERLEENGQRKKTFFTTMVNRKAFQSKQYIEP